MTRQECFNSIELRLSWLVTRIELRGALNILDLNIHSENFYIHFLKLVFDWDLVNLNSTVQNMPAIDLIDRNRRLVAQVSATATKQKINSALGKDLSGYQGHSFKFICIGKPNPELRKQVYTNPHGLAFSPADDIFDCASLLKVINGFPTNRMEGIRDFLERDLRIEADPAKVESNLAAIIKSINLEDWNATPSKIETIPYEIEGKITFNRLVKARALIDDYKLHHHRLAKIYAEYDHQGRNRSLSILDSIRREYLGLDVNLSADDRFFSIIAKVKARIRESANHAPMPDEELDLCVGILAVDAFIRCKIFENPLDSSNAHP